MENATTRAYKIYNGFFRLLDLARSAWISLLIVIVVYGLTFMAQSDTIFIDLLNGESKINLLAFYVCLFFLISMVSHYPTYIEFSSDVDQEGVRKIRWSKSPGNSPIGFITYTDRRKNSIMDSIFRHMLGLLLLAAVYYIAVNTYYNNIVRVETMGDWAYSSHQYIWYKCIGYLAISILFFVWIPVVAGTKFSELIRNPKPDDSRKLKLIFWVTTVSCFIVIIFTVIMSITEQWSEITYRSFCISLYALSFFYSVMRLCRKTLVFSSNKSFLVFLSSGICLSIIIIGLAHWRPLTFNSLVILICYFTIFYGVIIIPIKHFLFYRQYDRGKVLFQKRFELSGLNRFSYYFFSWVIPIIPYLMLAYVIWIDFNEGNNLHLLKTIPLESSVSPKNNGRVDMIQFNEAIRQHFKEKDNIYFIALYGGGLKATVWSDLVLNELAGDQYNCLLDDAVAISGVSGGGIGEGLYTILRKNSDSTKTTEESIKRISTKNYVAIDLIYLLGHDFLGGLMPNGVLNFLGLDKDRSKRSMQIYANAALGKDDYDAIPTTLLNTTFQDYWSQVFRQELGKNKFFPALIMNSSGSHIQRGISFSVRTDSTRFDDIFFDSTDLLSFNSEAKKNESLSFLDATSTVDRFPILSPPAKVEEKGYFLDGGYFENSGLMSLMDYSEYLRTKVFPNFPDYEQKWRNKKFVFIQICNDESVYLRHLMRDHAVEKEVQNEQEFSSVITTVISIRFVSSYLNGKFDQESREKNSLTKYYEVHLPYLLNTDNLKDYYRGTVCDPIVKQKIEDNNRRIVDNIKSRAKIDSTTIFDYVTPPLGRQMVRQSMEYMKLSLPISGLSEIMKDSASLNKDPKPN